MDRNHGGLRNEDDLDRLMQQVFGMDDDLLLNDFLLAQIEIKDNQIPPGSKDGFERLIGKIEERRAEPRYDSPDEELPKEWKRTGQRHYRPGPILRIAVAIGALLALLLAMGMTAGAKRRYRYDLTEKNSAKNSIALGNVASLNEGNSLENAYEQIADLLEIDVLRLGYIPEAMLYSKTEVSDEHERAIMYFKYEGNMLYVIQQKDKVGSSVNFISDRDDSREVYNKWLKKDILIKQAATEEGETEFSAYIVEEGSYYHIFGIMDDEMFEEIIRELYLERKN